MKIHTAGTIGKSYIIMLAGSFCTSGSLKYLYDKLTDNYCIILPEYNFVLVHRKEKNSA